MQWRLILLLCVFVIVVIFSLANSTVVSFQYFPGQVKQVSLALIIIVAALVGAIAGVIAGFSSQLRLRQQLQEKERQLRDLTRDNAGLADDVRAQRSNRRRQ